MAEGTTKERRRHVPMSVSRTEIRGVLIGRDAEVATVAAVVADRGTVVVTGPAGIGKTTVARASLGDPGTWMEGGALATLAWVPYLVFRRMIGTGVSGDPAEVAGSVARVLIRRGCTAILIDDAQWVDDLSLTVIGELARRFAVVATVRSDEPRSAYVIDAFACLGGPTVELASLTDGDAERILDSTDRSLAEHERATVIAHAGGNPLLLLELPHADPGDPTLVSALLGRSRGLGHDGRVAFERLAVLGRPVPPDLLGAGSGELIDTGLAVTRDRDVAVRHPLLAEALVQALGGRADQIRLELAKQVSDAEAAHLLAAADEPEAARTRALEAAASTTEPLGRAQLLALAIDCAPGIEASIDLRIEAANLFCDTSQADLALAVCDVDCRAIDRVRRGELRSAAARGAWLAGDVESCRRFTDLALADLAGTGTPAEVFGLAASTVLDTRVKLDGRPVVERARDAVTLADRVGAHQRFARVRLASVLYTAGETGWAEVYDEAVADAERQHDAIDRRAITSMQILAYWATGDATQAYRLAMDDIDRGPNHDHDVGWLSSHSYAAVIGLLLGVDRSRLLEDHRWILADEPIFRTHAILTAAVGIALLDTGSFRDADALIESGHVDLRAHGPDRSLTEWLAIEAAWSTGRFEEAASDSPLPDPGDVHPAAIQRILVRAHAARQAGHAALTGHLNPTASAYRAWSAAPIEWQGLQAAVDGRHAEAVMHFDEAAALWDGNDVRSATRCRWAAGDEARLAGSGDAMARLEAAAGDAGKWGLAPLVERSRASLRRCGEAGRSPHRPGRAGLTAREEEILLLVGRGHSSKEIAAALALGVSTVNSLIRSAVRKLGATNRLTAAAQLSRSEPSSP